MKIRCKNCGTIIKDNEKSCSVCHMTEFITDEKNKIKKPLKKKNINKIEYHYPIGKSIVKIILLIGIVILITGGINYSALDTCNETDCSIKTLFQIGLGVVLIISSLISLLITRKK